MSGFNTFYFYFFVALLIIAFFFKTASANKERSDNACFFIFATLLFLISAFRGENVGGDLEKYLPHFQEVCKTSTMEEAFNVVNKDYGFVFVYKIASLISDSNRSFLILTSILSLIGPFWFIKKYSPDPVYSLLLFYMLGFYTIGFNNLRQFAAISFTLYSIKYILARKFFKFFLIILVATSLHMSALIFLVIYPLSKYKLSFRKMIALAMVFIIFFIVLGKLVLNSIILYDQRFGDADLTSSGGSGFGLLLMYVALFILLYWLYTMKSNHAQNDKLTDLFFLFLEFTIFIQVLATVFTPLSRLTLYFFISVILLIPIVLEQTKDKFVKSLSTISLFVVLTLYMGLFIFGISPETGSNGQGVIPYEFSLD